MLVEIDTTYSLLQKLKQNGWKQNSGYATLDKVRVLSRNGVNIAVVKPIKVDPSKDLSSEIDRFFRTLMAIILKNGISDVFLPGGGTIPLPPFFEDFCKKHRIKIHVVTRENIDHFEKWFALLS
jgi:hypothetical protein